MFDLVLGSTSTAAYEKELISKVVSIGGVGTLFVGYPIVVVDDSKIEIDALITSLQHGVIAIDTKHFGADPDADADSIIEKQGAIYAALQSKLIENPALREGRKLAFEPRVISIHQSTSRTYSDGSELVSLANFSKALAASSPISETHFRSLNAVIQRSTSLRPRKKRETVAQPNSKGAILKRIEKEIANFDAWQKKAALEMPNGPQRIRGLAGSGKTIVLAQKASFLHVKHPSWRIVLTFHTRSLYQQLQDLVRRFTFEAIRDEPDWSKLTIMHAWGGSSRTGVYSEIAQAYGQPTRDFGHARAVYGSSDGFRGITAELLRNIPKEPPALYDAVLIDEAQDLPQPFFELCYHATKPPHRVVYAYDELQNLSDHEMTPPEQLFGKADGKPRVKLKHKEGEPNPDLILPICYRNTPWNLSTAHALGFGIYRDRGSQDTGIVQMFDDVKLWKDIGYRSANGAIELGQHAVIERNPDASPTFFTELLEPKNSIEFQRFEDRQSQADWLVNRIKHHLETDEVEHDDILIVLPDAIAARKQGSDLIQRFAEHGISSHLAGVTSGVDELFQNESVAITSIFRAKGNEAPIVYFVDAHYCASGVELAKKRNVLFTAMTRSRAWIYVSGIGDDMKTLSEEFGKVVKKDFKLDFTYPTKDQLKRIRTLNRDLEEEELKTYNTDLVSMMRILERINDGRLSPDALPKDIREQILKLTRGKK